MNADQQESPEFQREQLESIFSRLPAILTFETLAAVILVVFAVFTIGNYHWLAFVWLILALAICAARTGLYTVFRRVEKYHGNMDMLGKFLLGNSIASGLIWGTTFLLMPFTSMDPPRGAIILWPCAMITSAAVNYAASTRIFLAAVLPAVLPQYVVLLIIGGEQATQMLTAFFAYTLFVYVLSLRMHTDQNHGIAVNLENKQLQIQLKKDEEQIHQQKDELLTRIQREQALLEEKRRADAELAFANEEKLLLLDATGEGIFGTDGNGRITFVNESAKDLLKYRENDVIGQDALALLCRSNAKTGKEETTRLAISKCFHSHESIDGLNGLFFGAGDLILPVKFSCRPILKDEEFIGAVVSFFDMTNQIEMEHRLVQSQKMEAIGRITGGVAHDFNNLLTVILGNLKFLKRRLASGNDSAEVELIDKISRAAERGSELNNRLLSFSREQSLKSDPEDLVKLLPEMRDFLSRILGEDIELRLDIPQEPSVVMIDRAQFENAMLNLCLNARDAMPRGGRVDITCKRIGPDQAAAENPDALYKNGYLELSVADTGTGIPQEILNKVFDPFFTTKPIGEGSGLGLSTAYGFIQQSGGNISVSSTEGEGTCFLLQIPLDESIHVAPVARAEEHFPSSYSGTVLVVEDDRAILDIARAALMEAGYNVLVADNARAGLEKFYRHPEIDLVFSDIIMPGGLSGIEMANEMLSSRPSLQILLATGYTQKILKDRVEDISNIMCISKPYDIDTLPGLIDSLMKKAA